MAQSPGRAGGAARHGRGQQQEYTEAIVVVVSQVCRMIERYIAVQRTVLARFPEYGNATGRAALGARLDQLEALIREAATKSNTGVALILGAENPQMSAMADDQVCGESPHHTVDGGRRGITFG